MTKQGFECVHKLVLLAFHEQPPGTVVMHLNGDPQDNRADNLRWGTRSEVLKRSYVRGKGNVRLSGTQVLVLRDEFDEAFPEGWQAEKVPGGSRYVLWAKARAEDYNVIWDTCRAIATRETFGWLTQQMLDDWEGFDRVTEQMNDEWEKGAA